MEDNKRMNRRDFLKIVGISTATVGGLFYGCDDKKQTTGAAVYPNAPATTDKMTDRTSDKGEKNLLLG